MLRFSVVPLCLALLWTTPVSACATGPWPVDFGYGSVIPDKESNFSLANTAMQSTAGRGGNYVRVVVYNPGASSPRLWKLRLAEVRLRLAKYGARADRIEVVPVPTRGGVVAGRWIGRKTSMTVEVAKSCGS